MKNLIKTVIISAVCLITLGMFAILVPKCAHAYETSEMLHVEDLYVQYMQYLPGGSDPLVTQNGLTSRSLDKNLSLVMNTQVLRYGFINTNVHSDTDSPVLPNGPAGQFRSVGLEMSIGLNITQTTSIGYYHHSQHVLDTTYVDHFPVKDAIVIKFHLIRSKSCDSLF